MSICFSFVWLGLNTIWLWPVVAFMRRLEGPNACGLHSLRLITPWGLVGALSCECKSEKAMQGTVFLLTWGRLCACVCVCVCVCVFVCTLDRCRSRRVQAHCLRNLSLLVEGYMVECERRFASMCSDLQCNALPFSFPMEDR